MLAKTGNINLIASTTFFTALLGIGSQSVEIGITETFGIEATAAFARGDLSSIFKKFKQAIIIQAILFSLFYIIPSFFVDSLIVLIAEHEGELN